MSLPDAVWRHAEPDDADRISVIEQSVHTVAHERVAVFREKISLFPEGCRVLSRGHHVLGYGISYPWRLDDTPALDVFLGRLLPDANCLFVHDVAILPEGRGVGGAAAFIAASVRVARRHGFDHLALVSVNGTQDLWGRCGFVPRPSAATTAHLAPYGDTARYMAMPLDPAT